MLSRSACLALALIPCLVLSLDAQEEKVAPPLDTQEVEASATTTPAEKKAAKPLPEAPSHPNRAAQSWEGSPNPTLAPEIANAIDWRCIGPANMGGRITALAVNPKDHSNWWAATASGGLLRTTNDGTTFEHQFDAESTVSIGAIAVAPSNPKVLYVGTGESNPRNSVSWGDGVYRSEDAGETWKRVGLEQSFQIGAIAVHPENADVVYVGALGRLWGKSDERGLYKSEDGGKTWERILFVNDQTGVIDIDMNPADPDKLLVATYERQRDMFDTNAPALRYGEGSGLYRTSDGGKSFEKVSAGMPSCKLGRLAVDWYQKDPKVVYALVETEKIGGIPENSAYAGLSGENAELGAKLTRIVKNGPAAKAELEKDDIVIRVGEHTVKDYNDMIRRFRQHVAGDTVTLEVFRDRELKKIAITFDKQPKREGRAGERAKFPFRAYLSGQRENVQDQQGPEGHEFGGVFRSADGGRSWTRINSLNPRPMYFSEIRVDPSDESFISVLGVQLHRSKDGGKVFTNDGGRGIHVDHHAQWINPKDGRHIIHGCDGGIYVTRDRMENWDHLNHVAIGQFYHVGIGSNPDYYVYGGLQDNGSWGGPARSRNGGALNPDWFRIGGGDGFICLVDPEDPGQVYFESQNGGMGRRHLSKGERGSIRPARRRGQGGRGAQRPRYRFNWRTPFLLSHHNSKIHYSAGNHVFRSLDRGTGMRAISPEITRTDRGSATALGESPRNEDEIWVGTDDGALWMTRDGGRTWTDLFAAPEAKKETEPEKKVEADEARPRRRRRGDFAARLKRLDTDGDGIVKKSEVPERMARMFDRFDGDGDGSVALAEIAADAAKTATPKAEAKAEAPAAEAAMPSGKDEDPLVGVWEGKTVGEGAGSTFTITLKKKGKSYSGNATVFGEGDVSDVTWDAKTRKVTMNIATENFDLVVEGQVDDKGVLRGSVGLTDRDFRRDFEARLGSSDGAVAKGEDEGEKAKVGKPLREHLPEPIYVSDVVPSRFADGRVYAAFDGHRSDYDEPFLFVTEDHGKHWRALHGSLPAEAGSVRCLVEDLRNENLLFLGCEFGPWVSIDRGATWTKFRGEFPTVAVHSFALHPTTEEVVVGTHGRSIWLADISVLRQLSPEIAKKPAHLFAPAPAIIWRSGMSRGDTNRRFRGENPSGGLGISYHLAKDVPEAKLEILGEGGEVLRTLEAPTKAGLQRVTWDLRRDGRSRNGRRGRGPRVNPGRYTARLTVNGESMRTTLRVEIDPAHPDPRWIAAENAAEVLEAELEKENAEEESDEVDLSGVDL
jgi:photosystem II stability/assembly factor-like uncharacterized protein